MPKSVYQLGRSMIEMLGVLAIIGVLSVGGIAGYSKAMEKFKVNKLMAEYNDLIFGLLEHRQSFQENIKGETCIVDVVQALNLVPETWTALSREYIQDSLGNWINPRFRPTSKTQNGVWKEGIIIDFNLGGLNIDENGNKTYDNFNEKICFEMFNNIIQPLHNTLKAASMTGGQGMYVGDTFCQDDVLCLNNMTLSQMKNICSSCNRKTRCNVTIIF